jgi:hypothetical protein
MLHLGLQEMIYELGKCGNRKEATSVGRPCETEKTRDVVNFLAQRYTTWT